MTDKKADTWMPLLVSKYLQDTMHLSTEQHGGYLLLLMHAWSNSGALPTESEKLRRITRMSPSAWASQKDDLIRFFIESDGALRQKRLDIELARASNNIKQRSEAGKASAAKRAAQQKVNERSAAVANPSQQDGQQTAKPLPTPLPSEDATTGVVALAEPPKLDCPHLAILALWGELVPGNPTHKPEFWSGSREDHLRARWKEAGRRERWQSEAEGLSYFRRLFVYIDTKCGFLCGRAHQPGKRPFFADLEWVVTPANWAKIHEGKYEDAEVVA
jgi:uncharacterized protein YdaU (DUF1376 family)